MDKSSALTILGDRLRRLDQAERELDAALLAAKAAGATNVELAAVLGLNSPQAASWRLQAARRRIDERKQR
jgi:hypothetical protein